MFYGSICLQDLFSSLDLGWYGDYVSMMLIFILISVFSIMVYICSTNNVVTTYLEYPVLETVWTILPGVILIFLGIPTLQILYNSEMMNSVDLSIKSTGHQWYWSYDYSDFISVEFDSYMKDSLVKGENRLLEVTNRMVVPINTNLRVIITSSDVIHSWAVPSLGVKVDANPGRMNLVYFHTLLPGLFFGQCSEICGANHSFMPIVVESTSLINFMSWAHHLSF